MNAEERAGLVESLGSCGHDRDRKLKELGIPRSTYYRWNKLYEAGGVQGLEKRSAVAKQHWNRLNEKEEEVVLEIARGHPELSPRLLAVKISDEQEFSVSESTVYRLLKERGLIDPRALEDLPAAKQWKHQTTATDQIWQCDATNFFVVGWGYYKGIPVMDDYSRKILAFPVKPDETSFLIADAIEEAMESARTSNGTWPTVFPKTMNILDNSFTRNSKSYAGPRNFFELASTHLIYHGHECIHYLYEHL